MLRLAAMERQLFARINKVVEPAVRLPAPRSSDPRLTVASAVADQVNQALGLPGGSKAKAPF